MVSQRAIPCDHHSFCICRCFPSKADYFSDEREREIERDGTEFDPIVMSFLSKEENMSSTVPCQKSEGTKKTNVYKGTQTGGVRAVCAHTGKYWSSMSAPT